MLIPSEHVELYLNNKEKNICFQKEVSEKKSHKVEKYLSSQTKKCLFESLTTYYFRLLCFKFAFIENDIFGWYTLYDHIKKKKKI